MSRTSGLDPATGRELLRLLRRLAQRGSTIVLTTHAPRDIGLCDRVVFLAPGGALAFAGPPRAALAYFEVGEFDEVYERIAAAPPPAPPTWFTVSSMGEATPDPPAAPWLGRRPGTVPSTGPEAHHPPAPPAVAARPRERGAPWARQWAVLTRRTAATLLHNRLTLAILAGSPLLVIAMFAVLFRPGAFEPATPDPGATLMILYWVAFAAFFFGLTYGLLMICTEAPAFLRERAAGLRVSAYVVAKVTVLLAGVVLLMLAVLRLTDRLPAAGADVYLPLALTLLLEGVAAVALGLLASAAVTRAEQATLALPMICFPQVLLSGAILPVPVMAGAGKVISFAMTDRWGFEALGRSVDLNGLLAGSASPLGRGLLAEYGDSFARPLAQSWLMLALSTALFLALTGRVLARKGGGR